jgi:magnesium transporter
MALLGMRIFNKFGSKEKIGLPPGTLVHVGERKAEKVKITIIDYDREHFEEKEIEKIEECFPFKEKPTVTWINIDGLQEVGIVEKIGAHFGIHPLVLEDIVHTGQRPKGEDLGEYLFIVLKMIYHDEDEDEIMGEQISLILGQNYVISFQEREGDIFNPIRNRIRNGKGRIRKAGADYLAYALVGNISDSRNRPTDTQIEEGPDIPSEVGMAFEGGHQWSRERGITADCGANRHIPQGCLRSHHSGH